MKLDKFPEANRRLLPPADMTEKECGTLDVYTDGTVCLSLWKPSWRERLSILFRGELWLSVHSGRTQPPVALETRCPFQRGKVGVEIERDPAKV